MENKRKIKKFKESLNLPEVNFSEITNLKLKPSNINF